MIKRTPYNQQVILIWLTRREGEKKKEEKKTTTKKKNNKKKNCLLGRNRYSIRKSPYSEINKILILIIYKIVIRNNFYFIFISHEASWKSDNKKNIYVNVWWLRRTVRKFF